MTAGQLLRRVAATPDALRWAYYATAIEVNTALISARIDALIFWQRLINALR